MSEETIRLGWIGCGAFGRFAVQHFLQIPGVELIAIAETDPAVADAAARRFGVPNVVDVEALVQQPDIDLIYIATPPFLHHPQAMLALEAGKHVICEKPLNSM
ncbi:MAG: Gfo/Idh/MocA family protein [Candidatus Bipolaricaulia bacterium]